MYILFAATATDSTTFINYMVAAPIETRRIFKGTKTKIKYFPFLASVHIFNQFTCAGSIIHDDLVITAASCLQLYVFLIYTQLY